MPRRSLGWHILGLAVWLLITFAASAIGAIASVNSPEFYRQLDRPPFAPPAWLFGPVWTVLYILQGIAAWLIWRERGLKQAAVPLTLFVAQLAVNALWTWLFFAWRMGGASFAEILVLDVMIVATIVLFWRIRPLAGALLLPYLAWVTFASVLTYSIWQRNPQLL
jgi:tryptophan-rich sensory protein